MAAITDASVQMYFPFAPEGALDSYLAGWSPTAAGGNRFPAASAELGSILGLDVLVDGN